MVWVGWWMKGVQPWVRGVVEAREGLPGRFAMGYWG